MDYSCQYPIQIVVGETFILPVTYEDNDGNIIPLTNYHVYMQVRKTADDADVLIDLNIDNGGIILDGANGRFDINIASATTKELDAPMEAIYDLFIVSNSGVATRILQGNVSIIKAVTTW